MMVIKVFNKCYSIVNNDTDTKYFVKIMKEQTQQLAFIWYMNDKL